MMPDLISSHLNAPNLSFHDKMYKNQGNVPNATNNQIIPLILPYLP